MDQYLSVTAANYIGFAGSFCIIAAFAYANSAQAMNKLIYNVVNFIGAALLAVSLTVNYNLPTLVLEFVWMAIALYGIAMALSRRKAKGETQ